MSYQGGKHECVVNWGYHQLQPGEVKGPGAILFEIKISKNTLPGPSW